jgi:hypothetical protein
MQALAATASDPQLYGAFQQMMMGLQNFGMGDGSVPPYIYSNAKRSAKMDYLMLPILAKFGWNFTKTSPWRVYVDAGPYVGLLLSAKNVVTGDATIYADKAGTQQLSPLQIQLPPEMQQIPEVQQQVQQLVGGMSAIANGFFGTQDIKDQLHPFNWGLEANVGIQYQIHRNKIFIEGGGNYGLMNIQKSTGKGQYLNGKNHIGAGSVMIGYAYTL